MRHEFHPEALSEFEEAVQFYKERGRTLGRRFAKEIRNTIAKAVAAPDCWRAVEQDVQICRARVFPYAILYTIEADYILIVAIAQSHTENAASVTGGIGSPQIIHQNLREPRGFPGARLVPSRSSHDCKQISNIPNGLSRASRCELGQLALRFGCGFAAL